MHIAVTGASGFLGRYVVNRLLREGHTCRCWYREGSDRGGFDGPENRLEWIPGELGDAPAGQRLVRGMDAVVHAALYRPGSGFRGAEGDITGFVDRNVLGSLRLMRSAREAGVGRFVYVSSCAVHDVIMPDRPLDETHPTWSQSHYGAHKAAVEQFVHSYGLGEGWDICALRPTGIYGLARPAEDSKWYQLVHRVRRGEAVDSSAGGKEVHAADVAKAVSLLLTVPGIAGQSYNCYDLYVSDERVARIARDLTGSRSKISERNKGPRHQIQTARLRALGMTFGGEELLRQTVAQMLEDLPA